MRRTLGVLLLAPGLVLASAQAPDDALRAALLTAIESSESFPDRYAAEVWLLDYGTRLQRWLPDEEERYALLRLVHAEAARAELPPELVLSVIEVESAFDRFAISSAGALGLMQVMPFWIEELGRPEDNLFDPATNLRYGCTILKHYLSREDGNLHRALGRYNGRISNNPYQGKVLRALNRRWFAQ